MMVGLRWQTGVFALCAGLAVLIHVTAQLDLELQIMLLAPLVAVLGLPHGALDLPIAETLWPVHGWRGKLRFVLIYLGLAGGVIVVWLLAPGIALMTFLAYSAVHFSDDWASAAPPLRWTGGLATVGAPALLHQAEVAALFGYLAGPAAAGWIADAASVVGAGSLFVFMVTIIVSHRARGQAAAEQAILWGAALVLPPLIYFAVYFCALHSIRHFTATIRILPRAGRALSIAALLSASVSLAAISIVQAGQRYDMSSVPELAVQVIFIGLAALTVPHMILVEKFHLLRPDPPRSLLRAPH